MKRQISNEQTGIAQVVFVILGMALPCFILTFFFNNVSNLGQIIIVTLCFLFGLICLYFSTKLYTVVFDNDFIYFSRFQKVKKIDINKAIDIYPSIFPFRLFYRNVYLMTLVYSDNDSKRKIYFLSKGTNGRVGTVNDVPFLDTFRQLIRDKKYSR